ncbi:MAG: hypothetical protein SFV15_11470 [Polyangiaceae bacterium]|nr:hypothetical protein [Polyangiaceae bacterium]
MPNLRAVALRRIVKATLFSAISASAVVGKAAAAKAASLSVEWAPQAICTPPADLERLVSPLLGQRPDALLKEDLRVRLSLAQNTAQQAPVAPGAPAAPSSSPSLWVLIAMHSPSSSFERRLGAPDCAQAAEATALVIALAIDPLALVQTRDGLVAPPTTTPGATTPGTLPQYVAPVAPPLAVPVTDKSTTVRPKTTLDREPLIRAFHLEAGPAFDAGTLPKPRVGISAAVALSLSALRAEVGFVWLPSTSEPIVNSNGRIQASLSAGQARLCWFTGSKAHGAISLGLEGGELSAESVNVTTPGSGSTFWVAGLLGARADFELVTNTLALWARPELVVPFARRGFTVVGPGSTYEPSVVSGRGTLGLQGTF